MLDVAVGPSLSFRPRQYCNEYVTDGRQKIAERNGWPLEANCGCSKKSSSDGPILASALGSLVQTLRSFVKPLTQRCRSAAFRLEDKRCYHHDELLQAKGTASIPFVSESGHCWPRKEERRMLPTALSSKRVQYQQ